MLGSLSQIKWIKSGLLVYKQTVRSVNKRAYKTVHQAKIYFNSTNAFASNTSRQLFLLSAKANPHRYPRPCLSLNFHSAFLTSFTLRSPLFVATLTQLLSPRPLSPIKLSVARFGGSVQSVFEDEVKKIMSQSTIKNVFKKH